MAEFRENNITLQKAVEALTKKFEGIDPEVVKADRARLAQLEGAKPDAKVAELEAALAAERAARTASEAKVSRALLREAIGAKALKAGAQPAALDVLLDNAEADFTVTADGVVTAKPGRYSESRPGELITADDWLGTAIRTLPFLFKPSSGGNASPARSTSANANELLDPSAADLGKHADAIRRGTLKIRYS